MGLAALGTAFDLIFLHDKGLAAGTSYFYFRHQRLPPSPEILTIQ